MRLEFFRQKRFDFTHTRTTSPTAVGGAIQPAVTRVLSSLSLCDIQFYNIIRCVFFYRSQTKFAKVMFSQVGGRGVCIGGSASKGWESASRGVCTQGGLHPRGDMVNERAVRILLECIPI